VVRRTRQSLTPRTRSIVSPPVEQDPEFDIFAGNGPSVHQSSQPSSYVDMMPSDDWSAFEQSPAPAATAEVSVVLCFVRHPQALT
jgi:hypothetical protein